MARFTATREVAAPVELVWARLTDWASHGRWVPLTSMTVTRDTGGVGTVFVGRSGIGPLGFDDPMEVVRWDPPTSSRAGTAGVEHRGRVVLGVAEVQVVPLPGGRCRVRWTEDVSVLSRRLSRAVTGPLALGGRLVFGAVLARMAREVEAESARRA
ncbi:SRPBCC family protein [Quadrisphaera sp. DSM 44207]|uniref:SRPBCC family protein n=1 Tax=Quadrisphaera sp. DSM 44207 TaxID=1881057 RepID=UPI00089013DF|nr:SRPBCC family protein [Quadrisphaera sp. DSM 44207]SDQ71390.1 Carbon monoxide dehydrogenase subunit G [Quadrisphaera sp. DSM 44207]